MMQRRRGSPALASMPDSNGATSWHSESRHATHCPCASLSERRQRAFCEDSRPWARVDRFDRRLDGHRELPVGLIGAGSQAVGKLAGADFGGVAGGLRGMRILGVSQRAKGDHGGGKDKEIA